MTFPKLMKNALENDIIKLLKYFNFEYKFQKEYFIYNYLL